MAAKKNTVNSKKEKVLHPNSRKTRSLIKKVTREGHKQKRKTERVLKQNVVLEKMLWVQENMIPDVCPYTPTLTAELLQKYMSRFDEELEQISIIQSISVQRNKRHANRENVIKMVKEREQEEYKTCGIEIPDILNTAQCKMLRDWNGDARFFNNFKFRRFGAKHLEDDLKKKTKNECKKTESTETNENSVSEKNESDIPDSMECT